MTPEQFCYWLQGRAELQPDVPLSDAEWKSVREHLQLVFKKVTPALGPSVLDRALTPGWPHSIGPQCVSRGDDHTVTVTC